MAFIAGLTQIFKKHDNVDAGVTAGATPNQVKVCALEYADDAGLLDETAEQASTRLTSIATGSRSDAAMEIFIPKTKAMHIHRKTRVSETTEEDIAAMGFTNICPNCQRDFPTKRGLAVHQGRWCDGGKTERSRKGSLADKRVQHKKRVDKESELDHVTIEGKTLDNVYSFDYLGSTIQCDGDDRADITHRMNIAQTVFNSLHNIWNDNNLSRGLNIKLYKTAVCSTFTHTCESWNLTEDCLKIVNGFNSRCLSTITKTDFRDTATNPEFDLVQTIKARRLRFLGHILRMEPSRLLRRTLLAYLDAPPTERAGTLLHGCDGLSIEHLCKTASDRRAWSKLVAENSI